MADFLQNNTTTSNLSSSPKLVYRLKTGIDELKQDRFIKILTPEELQLMGGFNQTSLTTPVVFDSLGTNFPVKCSLQKILFYKNVDTSAINRIELHRFRGRMIKKSENYERSKGYRLQSVLEANFYERNVIFENLNFQTDEQGHPFITIDISPEKYFRLRSLSGDLRAFGVKSDRGLRAKVYFKYVFFDINNNVLDEFYFILTGFKRKGASIAYITTLNNN